MMLIGECAMKDHDYLISGERNTQKINHLKKNNQRNLFNSAETVTVIKSNLAALHKGPHQSAQVPVCRL